MTFKTRVEKTKEFVKKHPTTVACAVTAVVTHQLTYKMVVAATTDMAYEWGRQNGVLALQSEIMDNFITRKELGDEFREFVLGLKE